MRCPFTFFEASPKIWPFIHKLPLFWNSWNYCCSPNQASFLLNTIKHLTGHWVFLSKCRLAFFASYAWAQCVQGNEQGASVSSVGKSGVTKQHAVFCCFFFLWKNNGCPSGSQADSELWDSSSLCVHNLLPPLTPKYFWPLRPLHTCCIANKQHTSGYIGRWFMKMSTFTMIIPDASHESWPSDTILL